MNEFTYLPGQGLFYHLDPRSKLIFVASLILYLALESTPSAILLTLLSVHILCMFSKSTRHRLPTLWKTLAPLLITVVVLGSLRWRADQALLSLGPISITLQSTWTAIGLGARIAGMSFGLSLFLWTTEPGEAVAGLTRLGLPFELGFPTIMAMQYVTTFRRTFYQILEAQESRGLTLPRGNPIKAARAYIPILVPLIITALRSVDNLALALQSRGFGAGRPRTSYRTIQFRAYDWIFLISTWCVLVGFAQV